MDTIDYNILELLKTKDEDITISEIAKSVNIERHTAAKRLEVLKSKGAIESRTIGKSRVWKISKAPFINALKNNDSVINNFKEILQSMEDQVNIKSNDHKTIWSNRSEKEHTCCKGTNTNGRCKTCLIEKTFKTGNGSSSTRKWKNNKQVSITTRPIKDSDNNTVAVVEIIKDVKR